MKRLAILTAGGDCPGLNAVIRGVTARAAGRHGAEVVGILDGWDGLMEGQLRAARPRRGARHPPARRHDPRHVAARPVRPRRGRRVGDRDARARGDRRGRRDRRRRHAPHGAPARGGGRADRRRPEDDRQRHRGDRRHLRLRHGGADRDRGDRPHHDDGRVARPRDARRGDGTDARVDRDVRGHRGRRGRDPRPEEPYDLEAVADVVRRRADRRPALLGRRRRGGHRATCPGRASPRRSTRSGSSASAASRCSSRHGSRS